MVDHKDNKNDLFSLQEWTPQYKTFINETRDQLKGSERRLFMARFVSNLGYGGALRAERELGWDRTTIRKGLAELRTGITCCDNYSGKGRKPVEQHLVNLLEDIKDIVSPISQTDPSFRTTKLYSPITAAEVYRRLKEDKGYSDQELPTIRTINNKLNQLGYRLKKVGKSKPKKKIPETDVIFNYVHSTNKLADETEGVLRISIDTKATVNIGPFSRGGCNRYGLAGSDHDFEPEAKLRLFGIAIPEWDENYFFFTQSFATSDFMVDALESLWASIKNRIDLHTIVINLDNGPDNSSRRSQFMNRLVEFAKTNEVNINLVYYPPYHSKYNPIERVWGVLENHWRGELLDSIEKALGLARTMKWKGKKPTIEFVKGVYEKGVKLTKKAIEQLEKRIDRISGIEKWAVDIPYY